MTGKGAKGSFDPGGEMTLLVVPAARHERLGTEGDFS